MTLEEMEAEYARMDALLKRLHDDAVTEIIGDMAKTKDPFRLEHLRKRLDRVYEIANRR